MLSAILFDLDGTLVNTDPLHFATWQQVLQELGMDIDRAFYQTRISGRLNEEIVRDILPHLSPEEGLKFAEDKEARFRNLGEKLEPMPGLLRTLAWVAERRLKQAVVTNAPRSNAEFMLAALNLTDTFPVVVLAEDAPRGKPDPAPYQLALKRLAVEPETAVVFEDSPSGIRSAVGAGIFTIGVASTHDPDRLIDVGASFAIPDFTSDRLWTWLEERA